MFCFFFNFFARHMRIDIYDGLMKLNDNSLQIQSTLGKKRFQTFMNNI